MMGSQIQEIKRLYLRATETTIEQDLTRAVEILKTLPDEQSRARAAVYMDGLSTDAVGVASRHATPQAFDRWNPRQEDR